MPLFSDVLMTIDNLTEILSHRKKYLIDELQPNFATIGT